MLDEEVDRRSTSYKWWFDSHKCTILLACFILKNNYSQQYGVPDMLTILLGVDDKVG